MSKDKQVVSTMRDYVKDTNPMPPIMFLCMRSNFYHSRHDLFPRSIRSISDFKYLKDYRKLPTHVVIYLSQVTERSTPRLNPIVDSGFGVITCRGNCRLLSCRKWAALGAEAVREGGQAVRATLVLALFGSELTTASANEVNIRPSGLVHFLPLLLKEVLMCIRWGV